MTETELDAVFLSLASASRRQMLDIVRLMPGCTVGYVADHFEMSRIGVLKHLNTLEDAGLITSSKLGRERVLYLNAVPLQLIHERWSDNYSEFWTNRLTRLKYAIEKMEGSA